MSRVVLLVVLVALAPLTGAAVTGDTVGVQEQPTTEQEPTTTGNDSASDVSPGARLAGVVGSQGAAIDGEVTDRSLGERLARANGSGAKAAAVAAALGDANATLDAVEERLAELRAEREAGNISEGRYRAKVAIAAQRGAAARAVANRSADATESIPAAALREQGIGPGAARNVSERAGRVVGQDVAEIARGIRGGGPPGGVGAPDGVGGPSGPMGPGSAPGGQSDAENRSGNGPNGTGPTDVGDVRNPSDDAGNGIGVGPGSDDTDAGPDGIAPDGNDTTVTTVAAETTESADSTDTTVAPNGTMDGGADTALTASV